MTLSRRALLERIGAAGGGGGAAYAAAACVLALMSGPSIAGPSVLQPTGKWIVNFDAAQCVAQRSYGTEEKPLYLVLKQPPLGHVMQLAIVRKGSAGPTAEADGDLSFDDQPSHDVSILEFGPKGAHERVYSINLPLDEFAAARTAKTLRIRGEGINERFALSLVEPLLKVMNDCVVDLREVWNLDDEQTGPEPVREDEKGDLRALFSADMYPAQALRSHQAGAVKVALLVDETGKVADCSVVETSGAAVLDAQSCVVFRDKAKFAPATGANGQPAKSGWLQRIVWRLG